MISLYLDSHSYKKFSLVPTIFFKLYSNTLKTDYSIHLKMLKQNGIVIARNQLSIIFKLNIILNIFIVFRKK